MAGSLGIFEFQRSDQSIFVRGNRFVVPFQAFDIATDRVPYHVPRLVQRSAVRHATGKSRDKRGEPTFGFRAKNNVESEVSSLHDLWNYATCSGMPSVLIRDECQTCGRRLRPCFDTTVDACFAKKFLARERAHAYIANCRLARGVCAAGPLVCGRIFSRRDPGNCRIM